MRWHNGLVAIRLHSSEGEKVVHIGSREDWRLYLARAEQQRRIPHKRFWHGGNAKTTCGNLVDLTNMDVFSEATEAEVNCEACIAYIEHLEALTPLILEAAKELAEYLRQKREWERQFEEEMARFEEYKLESMRFRTCYAHYEEPISALGLPDDLTSKIEAAAYGSIGEVMLVFVFDTDEAYRSLLKIIEHKGIAVLRSTLLIKGYFKPEDMLW